MMRRPPLFRCAAALAVAATTLFAVPAHASGGVYGDLGIDYYLNNEWSGKADIHFETWIPDYRNPGYIGDWDGNGVDQLSSRSGNRHTPMLEKCAGEVCVTDGYLFRAFTFGRSGDEVFSGDWDGDGRDTLAVRRGNVFHFTDDPLDYVLLHQSTALGTDRVIDFGRPGDAILVGDWDGDGRDTLAVRRGNTFYFADRLERGPATRSLAYGRAGDTVFVGDWNGDGIDTPVVRRGNQYHLTDSFRAGPAERVLSYGRATDVTLVGDWNGDHRDTLGVRRDEGDPRAGR